MKILVTGGAGYVGTSLIPQLLHAGHTVRVFDNLMFGGDQLLPFLRLSSFEFVKGDVRNLAQVADAIKGCDVIIHLAAIVGFPACRAFPRLAEETNVGGSKNIAQAALRSQLVLFGSTGSNYGSVNGICTEETPLHPLSLYGATKTQAEAHLLQYASTIAFRFATAFGLSPRLRLDLLVNDFTYRAVTQQNLIVYEKDFMRTFIHVHDMGRAFMLAIDKRNDMIGQVYNVGDAQLNYTKEQVCEIIQKTVKCYIHYADVGSDPDKRDYRVSYDKIAHLGYCATVTLEDGIAELIRGFKVLNFKSPYANV
jgi:nucleoside-diphosphate-sugar epimerase